MKFLVSEKTVFIAIEEVEKVWNKYYGESSGAVWSRSGWNL